MNFACWIALIFFPDNSHGTFIIPPQPVGSSNSRRAFGFALVIYPILLFLINPEIIHPSLTTLKAICCNSNFDFAFGEIPSIPVTSYVSSTLSSRTPWIGTRVVFIVKEH